jgi:hypothetical protein
MVNVMRAEVYVMFPVVPVIDNRAVRDDVLDAKVNAES